MSEYPGKSEYVEIVYVVTCNGNVVVVATHRDVAMAFMKQHKTDTGDDCRLQIADMFRPAN